MNRGVWLVALLVVGFACGDDDDDDSEGDGGTGGGAVMCTAIPAIFPSFEKLCSDSTSCVVAFHQINCCGTRIAIGINQSERARFNAAETTCQMQYPGCGCASLPTMADDGRTGEENTIMVRCNVSNHCETFIP